MMFNEIPNRDAWSVIRGFVHQVNVTILGWLTLKENEVLEGLIHNFVFYPVKINSHFV